MKLVSIQYWTTGSRSKQWAIIPSVFEEDFRAWINSIGLGGITYTEETQDRLPSVSRFTDFMAPTEWPSYELCLDYVDAYDILRRDR